MSADGWQRAQAFSLLLESVGVSSFRTWTCWHRSRDLAPAHAGKTWRALSDGRFSRRLPPWPRGPRRQRGAGVGQARQQGRRWCRCPTAMTTRPLRVLGPADQGDRQAARIRRSTWRSGRTGWCTTIHTSAAHALGWCSNSRVARSFLPRWTCSPRSVRQAGQPWRVPPAGDSTAGFYLTTTIAPRQLRLEPAAGRPGVCLPQGAEESEVLFTLIAERYERRSLGITSNLVLPLLR